MSSVTELTDCAKRLAGRRVLVTGASSGIGSAVVAAVSRAGGAVAAVGRRADALADAVQGLENAVCIVGDLADDASVDSAVNEAASRLEGLDAVVNAAGIVHMRNIADGVRAEWREMFDVNVLGLLAVTQAALPFLRSSPLSDVVNISSQAGRRVALPSMGVYAATKHAVQAISEALRLELDSANVRMTTVIPGLVQTPIFDRVPDLEVRQRLHASMQDRGLAPKDVADQVVHVLAQPSGVHVLEITVVGRSRVL
jgi:NADP-dependent 3-hydroxy acid dehydrogenase YdfG